MPLTPAEIAYAGKKLKPIIYNELVRIAEYEGEPVAFMITLPDINEFIRDLNGQLFPFGWAKLLWRLHNPRAQRARVPLMGVAKKLHGTRIASQLAFMLIEFTRRDCVGKFGIEIGGGLGAFKGKVWRVGLMGYGSRPGNVLLFLSALEQLLSEQQYRFPAGASIAAANQVYGKSP